MDRKGKINISFSQSGKCLNSFRKVSDIITAFFKRKTVGIGLYPLLPFAQTEDQKVDYNGIAADIKWLHENRIHGFISFGCMGQHYAPSEDEFNKVTDTCVDATEGDQVCVIGTTSPNTKEAIRRTKYAEDAGADAVMVAPPYALPIDEKACARHYQMVNHAIKGDIAIMVYDFPLLTRGFNMSAHRVWEKYLLDMKNIKALKASSDHRDRLLFSIADKINVLSGGEYMFWCDSMLGAKGIVAELTWAAPRQMLYFYEQCAKKNWFDPTVLKINAVMLEYFGWDGG